MLVKNIYLKEKELFRKVKNTTLKMEKSVLRVFKK